MYGVFELSGFNIGVLVIVAIIAAIIALAIYEVLVYGFISIALFAMALQATSLITTLILVITYYTSIDWGGGSGFFGLIAVVVGIAIAICHIYLVVKLKDFLQGKNF